MRALRLLGAALLSLTAAGCALPSGTLVGTAPVFAPPPPPPVYAPPPPYGAPPLTCYVRPTPFGPERVCSPY